MVQPPTLVITTTIIQTNIFITTIHILMVPLFIWAITGIILITITDHPFTLATTGDGVV